MSQAKCVYDVFVASGALTFPEGVSVVAQSYLREGGRVHLNFFVFPDGSELACGGALTCKSASWTEAGEHPYVLKNATAASRQST